VQRCSTRRRGLRSSIMQIIRDGVLDGKTAFITGGTSGINLGIAKRFAQAGADVAILGRNADKAATAAVEVMTAAAASVRKSPARCIAVTADVRKPDELEAAIEKAQKDLVADGFDILVCGAAGNFPAPAMGMSPNGFKSVIDIDVLGTFNAARLMFERLRKPGACVLNVSAPQAQLPAMMQAHVCAAKAGVDALTKVLALEWGPAGVRVNSIWPGGVDGTEGMARLAPTDEARKQLTATLPLGRFANFADIAETALFMCCDGASYMTGSVVAVDGGMSLVGFTALMPH
jgi:NAD(P)-dependent dehydrogenase (short-subunit alcohol dehydrogenase family)